MTRQYKRAYGLAVITFSIFVFFIFAEFQGFFVKKELVFHMSLKPLEYIVENVLEYLLVFPHFVEYNCRNVAIVSNNSAILQVCAFASITPRNGNNCPGLVVFGVCKVLLFV